MYDSNILTNFALEWDNYERVKEQDKPDVPSGNDKNSNRGGGSR